MRTATRGDDDPKAPHGPSHGCSCPWSHPRRRRGHRDTRGPQVIRPALLHSRSHCCVDYRLSCKCTPMKKERCIYFNSKLLMTRFSHQVPSPLPRRFLLHNNTRAPHALLLLCSKGEHPHDLRGQGDLLRVPLRLLLFWCVLLSAVCLLC